MYKSYGDIVAEWYKEQKLKSDPNFVKDIALQFEYNRYMRAFLKDNPNLSSKDAMKFWKLKRAQRGSNEYDKKDLELK